VRLLWNAYSRKMGGDELRNLGIEELGNKGIEGHTASRVVGSYSVSARALQPKKAPKASPVTAYEAFTKFLQWC
jgi:hypothetical protein